LEKAKLKYSKQAFHLNLKKFKQLKMRKIIDVPRIKAIPERMESLKTETKFDSIEEELRRILSDEFGIEISEAIIRSSRDSDRDITPRCDKITTEIVNRILGKAIAEGYKEVEIREPSGLYNLALMLNQNVTVFAEGSVGGSFGAYNRGATLVVRRTAERFCGHTSRAGRFVVYGLAKEGCGQTNEGAHFLVFGKARQRSFAQQRGGSAVVGGGLGEYSGMLMASGTVACFGENVGDFIGAGMLGGQIYIPGTSLRKETLGSKTKLVKRLGAEDYRLIEKAVSQHDGTQGFTYRGSGEDLRVSFNGEEHPVEGLVKIVADPEKAPYDVKK
jgi:formylmethanofuran dehydrogenase subunit C